MARSLRQGWRQAASMLTVVACVGLIAAAHSGLGSARMGDRSLGDRSLGGRSLGERSAVAMDETTGALGPGVLGPLGPLGPLGMRRRAAALQLSDEQRARIYDGVMRIPDAPVAEVPAPDIAEAMPPDVPLLELPAGVTREIPQVEGHKFVKLDDRILVIDPANRLVVAMIPRYKLLQ